MTAILQARTRYNRDIMATTMANGNSKRAGFQTAPATYNETYLFYSNLV